MIKPECEICIAVLDASTNQHLVWNKPLFETKSFYVLPSIGPLEIGHCMIVSKNHYANLLSMGKDNIQEFLKIVDYSNSKFGDNLLFAEHGSFNQQSGGSCIEHAHIHIIPSLASYYNVLDEMLPVSNKINELINLSEDPQIDFPYILSFNSRKQFRLYEAYNAHSQMMRKAICAKLGRDDWDWKQTENIENINKSIELWQML